MAKGLFECLHEANLGQYIEQFRLHGVSTLETLATLSLHEYVNFGITSAEDRQRLFQLIHIVKRVQGERRMSSIDMSVQDKENTPVKINTSSRNKSQKDAGDRSTIPSSLSIQWTPRKKGKSYTDPPIKQNTVQLNDSWRNADELQPISGMQPDTNTLKRLEDQGGILLCKPLPTNLSHRQGIAHDLRQSLSDSEVADELLDSSTNPADVTGFGAPKLKKSVVEVIDHRAKGYNYGIPGQNVITPARKQEISNLDTSKIKVCVRKRPLLRKEIGVKEEDIVGTEGHSTVVLNESRVAVDLTKFMQVHKYHFDEVFHESCSNLEVYNRTAKLLVPHVFKRAKATCFAYGQTGAGKTYTMLGNKETKGLYLLAAEDIFSLLAEDKTGSRLSVWVSYFEIYCGQLFDLLNARQRLHARENSRHNVCIAGLNEVQVSGPQGLIRVVEQGNRLRSTGSSGVNADSSRSHAILQIELQDAGRRKLGRFSFIDLAGSERACDTADPSKVTRFEGAEINTSLLALKECIRALDQDQRHTPFRQSKLTQVLKDSFVGTSRTCMIANIAPCASAAEHTLNTLRYADRVKELRKQTRATSSPSTPHLSAPTIFSPGNTSTPVKPVKQPLSTRQPTSTSTPIKSKTQRSRSSDNTKNKHDISKRKTDTDKTPFRKTPTRKTRSLSKSNRSSDLNLSKSVKNDSKRERKMISGSRSDEVKRRDTPSRREVKVKDAPSKKETKPKETPTKRSVEAKNQAREAFLMNSSLPVWEPPKEMELIQKTPEDVVSAPTVWEIDNPRFRKDKSNSMREEAKNESINEVSDSNGGIVEPREDLEENNNNSTQGVDGEVAISSEEQNNKQNKDKSFNSDSTLELLAEIDHALRNSLVSPLVDESPAQPSGLSSGIQQSSSEIRNDKIGSNEERSFQYTTNTKPYDSLSRNKEEILKQHQKMQVAVITGVKSPDPKKALHRSLSLPSQVELPNQSQLEPHHRRTPGLRSRLSGRGIQTLPSPRDLQKVTPRALNFGDKEKARQDPHDDSNTSINRPQTAPETENSSGVIVSTSFAEYLTSHGINIPDIIVSPDKMSPREKSKTGVLNESIGRTRDSHLHHGGSHSRPDYTLARVNNKYPSSGGDYRQSTVQNQHSHVPVDTRRDVPVDTQTHSHVPVDTRTHNQVPVDSWTHSHVPVDNWTHSHVPVDSWTHSHVPVDTRTHSHVPVDSWTHSHVPVDSWTHSHVPVDTRTHNQVAVDTQTHSHVPVDTRTHNHVPVDSRTHKTVETHNQRNTFVQSTSLHANSASLRQARQSRDTAIPCPRNINRSVQPDILHGQQVNNNRSHVSRPTPIGQNQDSLSNNSANPTPRRPNMQYNPGMHRIENNKTQSPVSVEVLRHSQPITASQDGSTPVAQVVQPNQHSIPRAFSKESLGRSGVYPSYQTSVQSPIVKETLHVAMNTQETSNKECSVRRLSYHESSQNVESQKEDDAVGRMSYHELSQHSIESQKEESCLKTPPSLQINLAGAIDDDVSVALVLAKDRLSGVAHQNSAIRRAKDLLLSAHAEQVDEIQQLCEKELMLIAEFKKGDKDLPEYLGYVEDLLRSKLRCIDTFRDQLDTFATHTPEASPRSPMEAW
ncbi:LOW QUALITY PROTEIN: uncharacterized protein [Amphiura filiformis]|uniref:LOW QUALITY PROTEIN: uncharacterized protein n=1 Tax=Amphiura filiformis TaxID=82378 RepID=UPI003B228E61